jgi:FlaA1/EpsC-like NDP-sugar epimerase
MAKSRFAGLRTAAMVAVHLGLASLSNYSAFLLRFDGEIPWPQAPLFGAMLPWLLAVRAVTFIPFRLYDGFWRYTSISDLRNIVAAVVVSTTGFYVLVHYAFGVRSYSRSIFVIDSILLICLVGGVRIAERACREFRRSAGHRRVLIYGAGDAGEMIVREMIQARESVYEPIGFIDDNRALTGQRIHGVPVLGGRADLPSIVAREQPKEILIAIPRAEAATIRSILNALEPHQVRITTLPTLAEIIDCKVRVSQIRELSPEDVLARAAIKLDSAPVQSVLAGKRVLVTGAGGSIGSELCRQIASLKPAQLLMLDRYENSLFALANDLADCGLHAAGIPIIADVGDAGRVETILRDYQPHIVFHAAAHKHVPLMEQHPCEAIKNNVAGTRVLADAAERLGVERFVLISSDKAVNPSSVMGATKRVAELLMQSRSSSRTAFLSVRFGNVLASNGSVVPRFLQQIRDGGPVTVTHPEIRRYFMLISEAVQLVLHAAARGSNGATYVLEMGDQVKLVDLARHLIRLSGLRNIEITYIGLRPGEKLFEELVTEDETVIASGVDKLMVLRHRAVPARDRLTAAVAELERLAVEGRSADALRQLRAIVPEFRDVAPGAPGRIEQGVEEQLAAVRESAARRRSMGDRRAGEEIVGPMRAPAIGARL